MSNYTLLKSFLCNLFIIKEEKILPETRIYEDLGIDGGDAFELISKFKSEFNVNMDNFKIEDYFAPEGIDLIGAFINFFKKDKKKLKVLYVHMLLKAMDDGAWEED